MAGSTPPNFRISKLPSCGECDENTSTNDREVHCSKHDYNFHILKKSDAYIFTCDDFKQKFKETPKVKEI